ncbi:MAG: NAD(+) synthase [Clostridiales bacterium GWE2_32_10]|nr:MAG: NAD(+) synthase [Clostridiales bacterium GWE2_32_10]
MKVYNEQGNMEMNQPLVNVLNDIRKNRDFNAKEYIEEKSNLLNRYMSKCGLKACVVAVSGGIDSAVVLAIVTNASRSKNSPIKKIIPLLLPILKSSGVTNQNEATNRGIELCERLGLKPLIVDLTKVNDEIRTSLEGVLEIDGKEWAIGQLGPYSRTPVLYYTTSLLNQEGYSAIVCGTTNKDEGAYLGYVGKASDGMVDLQIISDIHKSEVYQVASEIGIPESIIEVVPNGDMYDNRTDETVFGAPYDFVELYLNYLNFNLCDKQKILLALDEDAREQFNFYSKNLENLHKYNSHKYVSKSPAIHLDLWDSSVKGGWENYYKITNKLISS